MEKNFTLHDLQHYLQEVDKIERKIKAKENTHHGPSAFTMKNLFSYSYALNVLKTSSAGVICQLSN